ncbi:hypothetical protein PM082_015614 [Marasmius tenuissimus]|nr:hypothetical protein PM082_015614 [Marasmius tenuissimus]
MTGCFFSVPGPRCDSNSLCWSLVVVNWQGIPRGARRGYLGRNSETPPAFLLHYSHLHHQLATVTSL